jgi:adenosylcobinamide-GDP ribazoletransferase
VAEPIETDALPPAQLALRGWPPAVRGARAAFVFLSRLPLGGFPYSPADWRWAPAHFPLVGAVIGAAAALVFCASHALGFGGLLAATLTVASSVWLTGALHEDGLADSADGLGGAHGGKRALEIMRDSRIGSYGAVALLLSLLIRTAALSELAPAAWFALIYVHCLARVGPVWLMATQPYVGDATSSKSQSLFETRSVHVATAAAWGLMGALCGTALGGLHWSSALAVAAAVAVSTLACARYFRKAVGGITGDLLGAAEQVAEITAWLALLALRAG